MDLKGKCVLLGVTGGIAAYKMANVASALRKLGADVEVIMTQNATQFITPITFETLTGHKCMVDTFDRDFKFEVTHISLAKKADIILVAPATANVIAKMAHGIADDMLTTTILAAKCPKLVSPAMNTGMLENPITQDNIATLGRAARGSALGVQSRTSRSDNRVLSVKTQLPARDCHGRKAPSQ